VVELFRQGRVMEKRGVKMGVWCERGGGVREPMRVEEEI
jgi:hypothetical protein